MTLVDETTEAQAAPDTRLLARLEELGYRVEMLRTSFEWQRWLTYLRKFHRYSFGNQFLIMMQRPAATRVAGYRTWIELGRQVQRGEKGIAILRPRLGRKDPVTGERSVIGFGTASVFDIAQTLPIDDRETPEPPAWPFAGGEPMLLFEDLVQQVCAVTGLAVEEPAPNEGSLEARGWYTPAERTIHVRAQMYEAGTGELVGVPAAQRVKTLLHELGHHFDPECLSAPRDQAELVAESVAWVVASELGIDSDATVEHYLASWQASAEDLVFLARRITAGVRAIEDLLRTSLEVSQPA